MKMDIIYFLKMVKSSDVKAFKIMFFCDMAHSVTSLI